MTFEYSFFLVLSRQNDRQIDGNMGIGSDCQPQNFGTQMFPGIFGWDV